MELELCNDRIRVALRPDLGGRIDQITDRETGKDWLWHSATYKGEDRSIPIGASFDDNWGGGWDDVFPNDAGGRLGGRVLPDHGEVWSQPWTVASVTQAAAVLLFECKTVPVDIEKTVVIEGSGVKIRYLFQNTANEDVPFLLKLHAAISIEPGDEILLPSCDIEPVDPGFSTIIGRKTKTLFPLAYDKDGEEINISHIPGPDAQEQEFFYATRLDEPRCGIRNRSTSRTFAIQFDEEDLNSVWVFGSYGRWRGHYVLILEPCTDSDYDLSRAHRNGTCSLLRPKERREIFVTTSLESSAFPAIRGPSSTPAGIPTRAVALSGQ